MLKRLKGGFMAKKKGFFGSCDENRICRMIGCYEPAKKDSPYCEKHNNKEDEGSLIPIAS